MNIFLIPGLDVQPAVVRTGYQYHPWTAKCTGCTPPPVLVALDRVMGIRVEHFPDPRAPENLITVAYNREEDGNGERFVVARLSADTLTWMRQDGPFTLTEGSIKNVIEVQSEPVPMLSQLIIEADKAFYAKRI